MKKILVLVFLAFFSLSSIGQKPFVITGKVIDNNTKAPLPFVNMIVTGHPQHGATADIDGNFKISASFPITSLSFSYVGYQDMVLAITDTSRLVYLTVRLKEAAYELHEVKILPGINPALRIIRTAIANRDNNNPEKVHSFTYTSYNKMYCTSDVKAPADSLNSFDSAAIKRLKPIERKKDTSKKDDFSLLKFFKQQYLFLVESVSERRFLYPDHNYEKVVAQRTSGMKDSPFALLATQMQSFSFYPDHISILGDDYLNPVSSAGIKRYYYKILDTLFQGKDSVYIISFEPRKNKYFDGMKGVLYINTKGYAIQNVIAQPVRRDNKVKIHIQQKYEYIDNKQWFPAQLNTDWLYNNIMVSDSNVEGTNKAVNPDDEHNKIKIVTRSYIRDITLDTNLRKRDFGRVEVEIAKNANQKTEDYWNKYRIDTLSNKEKKTYHVIDSIGSAIHLDRKIKWYETLATGKLREGFVDWDLDKIVTYNGYEKFRLGAGLHTNDVLSRFVSIGGYGAYGFGDQAFKYGGDLGFILNPYSQVKLNFAYKNDVIEAGGVSFFNDQQFLSTETYRDYFINNMDKIQEEKISFSFDAFKYFQFNLFGDDQLQQTTNSYEFGISDNNAAVLLNHFGFAEAGAGIRFAYNEKFLKSPMGMISLGTKYPIVWINITKGLNGLLDGQYSYMKYDLKINKDFHIPQAGVSSVEVLAGYVQGNVPYTMLYNVRATYMASWESRVAVDNTFETMRVNEFLSNRYVDVFLSHDFQSFLYRSKKFNPFLKLVTNLGWGNLDNISSHYNFPFKIMDKGYYESGLEINNLIKIPFTSLGVGAYYRYGPYAFSAPIDNFVAKITLHIGL
jgi:hypothetical protein